MTIIHNGDHAEFELEHANTPPKERPDWPLPSFDARDWAEHYVKLHGGDAELMTGWFANALMRGFDERASRINIDVIEGVICRRLAPLKSKEAVRAAIVEALST